MFKGGQIDSVGPELSPTSTDGYSIAVGGAQFPAGTAQHQWFALRVRSNFERITALHLRERGYLEFVPAYKARSQRSDRINQVEKVLFPGYVFCRFNRSFRLPVLTTPGVLHIVGVGRDPIPIEESEIQAVWATLRSGLSVHPWPFLRIGEKVSVERGPLAGVEGIVSHFKGACRLVVSISLLQRSIAAEIERDWIRPVCQPTPPERSWEGIGG